MRWKQLKKVRPFFFSSLSEFFSITEKFFDIARFAAPNPQTVASERVFSALYSNKPKLLATRPLRIRLPPHPDETIIGETLRCSGGDAAMKPIHDLQQEEAEKEKSTSATPSGGARTKPTDKLVQRAECSTLATAPLASAEKGSATETAAVRVTVTAWRNGTKITLCVAERPAHSDASKGNGSRGTTGSSRAEGLPGRSAHHQASLGGETAGNARKEGDPGYGEGGGGGCTRCSCMAV